MASLNDLRIRIKDEHTGAVLAETETLPKQATPEHLLQCGMNLNKALAVTIQDLEAKLSPITIVRPVPAVNKHHLCSDDLPPLYREWALNLDQLNESIIQLGHLLETIDL